MANNQQEASGSSQELCQPSNTLGDLSKQLGQLSNTLGDLSSQLSNTGQLPGSVADVKKPSANLEKRPQWAFATVIGAAFVAIVASVFTIGLISIRVKTDPVTSTAAIITTGVVTLSISLVVIVFLMRYYGED